MINIETVCEVGKSLTVKRQKDGAGEEEIVRCCLKFSALEVERDAIDQLVGLPTGLVQSFYDDLGAPLARLELGATDRELATTGRISGTKPREVLTLGADCQLTEISIALKELGGLLSGTLTWTARGDEVEDVTDLLGRTCRAALVIVEPQQVDMLKPTRTEKPAARAHGRGEKRPNA